MSDPDYGVPTGFVPRMTVSMQQDAAPRPAPAVESLKRLAEARKHPDAILSDRLRWASREEEAKILSEPRGPRHAQPVGHPEVDALLAKYAKPKEPTLTDTAPAPTLPPDAAPTAPVVLDPVVRPPHYTRYTIEPIKFIMENELPFWMGNVVKYILRYDGKDGVQDLKKARRYLDMAIKRLEGDPAWSE